MKFVLIQGSNQKNGFKLAAVVQLLHALQSRLDCNFCF